MPSEAPGELRSYTGLKVLTKMFFFSLGTEAETS